MAAGYVGILGKKAATGGFVPTDLAGCQLWLDASDASTFTYSSGVVVSQWADKSGNARHATQGNTSLQPSRNGTQNGLTTVVFDGTDDNLNTAAPVSTATDNFTIFVAYQRTGGGVPTCIPYMNGTGGANGYGVAARANSAYVGFLRGGIAWVSSSTADGGAALVQTARRSSGTWSVYVDGTATSVSSSAAPYAPTGASRVGTSALTADRFGGGIFEVVHYDVALNNTDRATVEDYLSAKWGTP